MKRFGIVGNPLSYTLSPYIHLMFAMQFDKTILYNTWNSEKKDVKRIVTAIRQGSIQGISVTAPYKELAYTMVDEKTALAQRARAVNTVYKVGEKLVGDNTDIMGIKATLEQFPSITSATVLGTGATARSVIVALQEEGITNITLCGRNNTALKKISKEYGIAYVSWNKRNEMQNISCCINTIPPINNVALFTQEQLQNMCTNDATIIDVHYKPVKTPLLREALQANLRICNGLLLFVKQAQYQFERFMGVLPAVEPVYEELESLLLE